MCGQSSIDFIEVHKSKINSSQFVADSLTFALIDSLDSRYLHDSFKIEIVFYFIDLECDTFFQFALNNLLTSMNPEKEISSYDPNERVFYLPYYTSLYRHVIKHKHSVKSKLEWKLLPMILKNLKNKTKTPEEITALGSILSHITGTKAIRAILLNERTEIRKSDHPIYYENLTNLLLYFGG